MANKYIEVLNINNYKTELVDASTIGGGDNSVFECYISYDGTNPTHTFEELLSAYKAGKIVVLKVYSIPPESGYIAVDVCFANRVYTATSTPNMEFSQPIHKDGTTLYSRIATVNANDEWTVENYIIKS